MVNGYVRLWSFAPVSFLRQAERGRRIPCRIQNVTRNFFGVPKHGGETPQQLRREFRISDYALEVLGFMRDKAASK